VSYGLDLSTPLQFVKGVGEPRQEMLANKGLLTVEDLLYYVPLRYEDRTRLKGPGELRAGEMATVIARVRSAGVLPVRRSGVRIFCADIADQGSYLRCKWFHADYLAKIIEPGKYIAVYGKAENDLYEPGLQMIQPQYELLPELGAGIAAAGNSLEVGRIVPIYEAAGNGRLTSRFFRRVVHYVLETLSGIEDPLPASLAAEYRLIPRWQAIRDVHFPPRDTRLADLEAFRSPPHLRLIFEELFFFEAGLAWKRATAKSQPGISFRADAAVRDKLKSILPFHPTAAQKRALGEIVEDMRAPRPMRRLLQGDVGSGKTIVALQAAVVAIENGYQVAIMAPTEILAQQHFFNFKRLLKATNYQVVLLSGSATAREKRSIKRLVEDGLVQIVVGTHALVEEDVRFNRLGLVIIDEQHRFGVRQRLRLMSKGNGEERNPDVLVMTATPIPRTLALTYYGDLDNSVIDELPAGRLPIVTRKVEDSNAPKAYEFVRSKVAQGAQAFIVYPVIDDPGTEEENTDSARAEKPSKKRRNSRLPFASELKSALKMFEHLSKEVFPEFRIGLLHGRLPAEEKERTMQAFQTGEIQILVGTTVVEVGVDVPNASVMVVEQSERFGLAQLHQLRGRVGRGVRQSYCLLIHSQNMTEVAEQRLNALVELSDGFALSELDLSFRGPGEFLGTKQSGLPAFRVANLVRDKEVLEWARRAAVNLIERGDEEEKRRVLRYIERNWGQRYGLVEVG
jgi:ATP-dependent DNA helicase RecG